MKKEILEGNRLIAEFLGETISDSGIGIVRPAGWSDSFQYHSSWDWLMPVVAKIKSDRKDFNYAPMNFALQAANIEAAWFRVVEYIKWLNKKNPTLP